MTLAIARWEGCLMGLAVGDALGTTLEFTRPGQFTPLTDMIGGGPFRLRPGQWTDDTSMALCLADSLVACAGFDPHDQMTRYVNWYQQGYMSSTGHCFDIGNTTRAALHHYLQTNNPYSGATDAYTAGNGSIMRLAPVPMFYAGRPHEALEKSAASSRTTHAAPNAIDGCRYLAALILGALAGASKAELLAAHYSPIPNYWQHNPLAPEIAAIANGSFKEKQPPAIRGTGYVVQSLEAALWAFYHSHNFEEGCLLAVNLGEDADTTGAVYGQIAGAFYGLEGIPAGWCEKIAMADTILELARKLATGDKP